MRTLSQGVYDHVRLRRAAFAFCALSLIGTSAWAGGARASFVFWVNGDRPPVGLRTAYILVNGSDTLTRAVRAEAEQHHVTLVDQPASTVATVTVRAELALKRLGGVPHVLDYPEAVEEARKEAIADPKNHLGSDWQWSIQSGDFLSGKLRQIAWRRSGIAGELIPANSVHARGVRGTYPLPSGKNANIFAGMLLTVEVSNPDTRTRKLLVSATSFSSSLDPQVLFMSAIDSLMAELAQPGGESSVARLAPVMLPRRPPFGATVLPTAASRFSPGRLTSPMWPEQHLPASSRR